MIKYFAIAILAGIIAAIAQVLLKKSSGIKRERRIDEYLNWYVIIGYSLMAGAMLLMILSYRGMPYKYGSVLDALGYIYAMITGKLVFGEKITVRRFLGNVIIVVGIMVFSL